MNAWNTLREFLNRHILPEERMYRGETGIRLQDLGKLFRAVFGDDPPPVDPNGGMVELNWKASPRVWSRWARTISAAAAFASTGDDQYVGRHQGGTVMKRNYGGRVVFEPGKPRSDYERLPSAMDKYDVMMIGDVTGAPVPTDQKVVDLSRKGLDNAKIIVKRIAWSPSIGSAEERTKRLQDLLAGKQVELPRRAQGLVPDAPKNPDELAALQRRGAGRNAPAPPLPEPVPRQGHFQRPTSDDDGEERIARTGGGAATNNAFRAKLSRHNAEYQPSVRKPPVDQVPDDDDPDRLFDPRILKRR